jgi:hypothetical protein
MSDAPKDGGPGDADVEALVDAMCMVLNDLEEGGGVCGLVKAKARVAFEPFRLDDSGALPDLEGSHDVIAQHEDRRRYYAREAKP